MEKQREKKGDALKSLKFSNKTDELKQIESILWKSMLSYLIICKLREIIQLFAESVLKEVSKFYFAKINRKKTKTMLKTWC